MVARAADFATSAAVVRIGLGVYTTSSARGRLSVRACTHTRTTCADLTCAALGTTDTAMQIVCEKIDTLTVALGQSWWTNALSFVTEGLSQACLATCSTVLFVGLGIDATASTHSGSRRRACGRAFATCTHLASFALGTTLAAMVVVCLHIDTLAITHGESWKTSACSAITEGMLRACFPTSTTVEPIGVGVHAATPTHGGTGRWALYYALTIGTQISCLALDTTFAAVFVVCAWIDALAIAIDEPRRTTTLSSVTNRAFLARLSTASTVVVVCEAIFAAICAHDGSLEGWALAPSHIANAGAAAIFVLCTRTGGAVFVDAAIAIIVFLVVAYFFCGEHLFFTDCPCA